MQTYRPDIDGLRAIAVASVVLFHAGVPGFAGGFLGVDVFFVISGFLITQLLTAQHAPGIATFYERRIRRIVPALVVLLAACASAAFIVLWPSELVSFSRTLGSTVVFASNIHFMRNFDYFTPRAANDPLLHLWSLAVEEQFYIVYPCLLWLLSRFAKPLLLPALVAGLVASFAYSQWLALHAAPVAFYFSLSRAWELLLGAIVALVPVPTKSGAATEIASTAALLAVIASVPLLNDRLLWPAPYAALPCSGTAALLFLNANGATRAGRLLGIKPLAGLGLISYSLYLWHWPLFVFFERITLRPITLWEYAALIAAALALAWLSWRYVESPFRRALGGVGRRWVFASAAASFAALLGLSGASIWANGFPTRYSPEQRRLFDYLDAFRDPAVYWKAFGEEHCAVVRERFPFERCFVPASDRRNIVLWGDSHAGNYVVGIRDHARGAGFNLIPLTFHSCLPAPNNPGATAPCEAFNQDVLRRLDRRIAAVIVSGRFFEDTAAIALLRDTVAIVARRGIRVIVIGPSLEYRWPVPLFIARFRATHDASLLDSASLLRTDFGEIDERERVLLGALPGVTYISVRRTVCPAGRCPMIIGNVPMELDEGHLTPEGSRFMGNALWPKIAAALNTPK